MTMKRIAAASDQRMSGRHALLAVLVATILGTAFVVSKIGLETFSTALRFLFGATAAIFLPWPRISWLSAPAPVRIRRAMTGHGRIEGPLSAPAPARGRLDRI